MGTNSPTDGEQETAVLAQQQPAIGLIANETNEGGIIRTILRAQQQGHRVLVTHHGDPGIDAVEFAHQLGATIVHPDQHLGTESLHNVLRKTAKAHGLPGLVFHDGVGKIEFSETIRELHDSSNYSTRAKTQPAPLLRGTDGVLVAIPAFNEERTIAEIVSDASRHADKVLVVDDGSTDRTAERAEKAGAIVEYHERNCGYGAALKTAFTLANQWGANHLVILDADGQHDSDDIPRLVAEQKESEAQLVIGSRFSEGADTDIPRYRSVGLTAINVLTNLSFGIVRAHSKVRDTQSGFRAFDATAIESLAEDANIGNHMNASTDILYHAHSHNYRIREVGISIDYDVENGSHLNPISHGLVLVSNILQTIERERPIFVLGIPGFLSAFIGLGLGYWTFSNYIQTNSLPLGLAIASAFCLLAGIFACFTAIILHSLNSHFSQEEVIRRRRSF